MKRLRGCLLVLFIFACGLFVGGFVGAAFGWVGFFHKIVKGGPLAVQEVLTQRAREDLKLTKEQDALVKQIVKDAAAELDEATKEARPRVEEIRGRAEDRVREVLDEKQRKKFDPFVNKGLKRWKPATPAPLPEPAATPAPEPAPAQL